MQDLCIFGDSIAKGIIFDEMKQRYTVLKDNFIALAAKRIGLKARNFASFGATTKKGSRILDRRSEELSDCRYTLLEFGGNDCNLDWSAIAEDPDAEAPASVPLPEFMKTYEALIDKVLEAGSCPILLTLPPLDSDYFFANISEGLNAGNILTFLGGDLENINRWHEGYNEGIRTLAKERNLPLIDLSEAFPTGESKHYLCKDGMHPNEAGHRRLAECMTPALRALIA